MSIAQYLDDLRERCQRGIYSIRKGDEFGIQSCKLQKLAPH